MPLSDTKFTSAVEAAVLEFGNPKAITQLPTPGTIKTYIANQLNITLSYNEARKVWRRVVKARTQYKEPRRDIEIPVLQEAGALGVYERKPIVVATPSSLYTGRARETISHGR